MIKFYTNRSRGAIVQKIFIMLSELAIPHKTISIDMTSKGDLLDELEKINPNKKVPALIDEETGVILFESSAILYYLAEKTNLFLPKDLIKRSEVMKWLMFESANLSPIMLELIHYEVFATEALPDIHMQRYKENIANACSILDQQLSQKEYLCDEYSIADIATFPWYLLLVDLAEINLDYYPNLNRWISTIKNRPAVQTASTQ